MTIRPNIWMGLEHIFGPYIFKYVRHVVRYRLQLKYLVNNQATGILTTTNKICTLTLPVPTCVYNCFDCFIYIFAINRFRLQGSNIRSGKYKKISTKDKYLTNKGIENIDFNKITMHWLISIFLWQKDNENPI